MKTADIRNTFLEFFRERDHRIVPSASLIPNDPTLLLTVAGMVPFKPYFLGEATPEHKRIADVQKCARTNDIENVGVTTRHFTVFEMLGNWSFGDYFKREAIAWAWELSTLDQSKGGFGFEPERIWATIYQDDDEAEALWLQETDVPAERIVRRGKDDNFWSTGAAGPCGPCSELYYDRGPEYGREGGPEVDEERYLEFWNLVFIQYERDADYNIVRELPDKHVDTGMGLERMAMLLQGVPNAFEIDVVRPMVDRAAVLTGVAYGDDQRSDISLRVIAEHARACSFLIADGVLPSNEGRGYVLRRMLRRAVRHARMLGTTTPIMPAMTETVRATLGEAWPELVAQRELISRVAASEEEGFTRTLRTGTSMLDQAIEHAKASGASQLPGDTAFALHDTYGFPVDLTLEIAREHGLDLDRDAFAEHMEAQRTRARAAVRTSGDGEPPPYARAPDSTFVGYERTESDSELTALLTPGALLDSAQEGDELEASLAVTPFYAEGGGQLGDHGVIETDSGRLRVVDTYPGREGLTVHRAVVDAGEVRVGQQARAMVDLARRASIARGHTATHILHATLKEVLGEHAAQAGSAIDAGHFRFDFPHFAAVGRGQLADVEERVNGRVAANPEITAIETSQQDAREMGAVALFGEKYGSRVRVVQIGDFSRELCGGTHVEQTAEVGVFTIVSEGSIAANLRRIEAITGPEAFDYLSRERMVAQQVSQLLKVSSDELVERVEGLLERLRDAEKEVAHARQRALSASVSGLIDQAERIDGVGLVATAIDGADRDGLKTLALDLRNRLGDGVVVLGNASPDGNAQLVAAVSPSLVARGLEAREVLMPGARVVGGGAGGKGEIAQAGGREAAKLPDAVEACRRTARELIGSLT